MDVFESLTPCFGTCMMSLALMALILMGVVAYIEWCNEYERVQALGAEEEGGRGPEEAREGGEEGGDQDAEEHEEEGDHAEARTVEEDHRQRGDGSQRGGY